MIELIDLTKEYPGSSQAAVDKVNLFIEKGETMALLGPSGCGKTSTLNMIVGLEKPTSGDIRVNGQSIVNVPVEKRGIGLVFQDYAVFTSMTVRQNLAFGLEVRKTPKDIVKREVERTAEFIGLGNKLEAKARSLSGSELQRVAIGRTLVTQPSILLLDEPLSNLEPEARLSMRQELRRLRQELGLTIIYVTHDQVEALSLADRLAIMNFGRLIEVERTAVMLERPSAIQVAQFLGNPPMNILQGYYREGEADGGGGLFFRQGKVDFKLPTKRPPDEVKLGGNQFYYLGVRPEDLRLTEGPDYFVQGVVTGLERRGFDCVANITVDDLEIKALFVEPVPAWGETVSLSAPADKFFLYDRRGQLLTVGLPGN
ncbi:MAG: ABC transporter ATP-binding protein [Deltaproteobacteria bacterium]|jgi:multiple sugar transport system ATP-binding protein|nr:ABC transporter ATP-binding protein [Deltaproteobacteria bacterium]